MSGSVIPYINPGRKLLALRWFGSVIADALCTVIDDATATIANIAAIATITAITPIPILLFIILIEAWKGLYIKPTQY